MIRAKIPEATSGLAGKQAQMEQCYQDMHRYATTCSACTEETTDNFTFSCTSVDETTFTLTAAGINAMAGFNFTVNQSNERKTTGVPDGWSLPGKNCWVARKDGQCN
ncbi:MAG: type IV pilin protein [Zoogloeaceae bacterium]|nr:type IV pilin protein [Zoogloeaceae bacterium]